MTDEQLIQLYFDRDSRAVEETQRAYGPYCAAIARRLLTDSRDAEECLNDVWLSVWHAIPPARPEHFKGWLGAIVRNRALALGRKNGRAPELVDEPALELAACLPARDGPAGETEAKELAGAVSAFLRKQKPDAQTAFLRRYWYLDSVDEVAARFGWSESKTKSVLFRTRNRLRDYLIKEGYL